MEKDEEITGLKDRLVRTLADMENLRTRTSRQLDETKQFAVQGLAKEVLEVADNLERALAAVGPNVIQETTLTKYDKKFLHNNLKNLYVGVELTEKVRFHCRGRICKQCPTFPSN